MKKLAIFSVIFILILLSCVLFGCADSNDIPSGVPTSWKNYCQSIATAISEQALDEDGLNFKAQAEYVSSGKSLLFTLDFAYNPQSIEESAMAINVYSTGENLFSVKADNQNSYIDIIQNSVLSGAKIKIEGTNFFDWLNVEYNQNTQKETKDAMKQYVLDLCDAFFKNGDRSADGRVLSFELKDDVAGETLAKFAEILTFIDKNVSDLFLGALGVDDANEVLSRIGKIDGSVKFTLENGKVVGAKGENFSVENVANTLDVTFAKGDKDEIKATFPKSDVGYKITKMATSTIDGTLSNVDSGTKRVSVKYDFQLNTNVDVMKLVFNDYDLSCLADDNFLHLRLSHKCDSHCSEYCSSRISAAKGAVIDIAFSPSAFGSHNLYINTSIKNLMSREYLQSVSKYDSTVRESNLPDYCMFTLVPEGMAKNVCKLLIEWYSDIMTAKNDRIEFSMQSIKDVFAESEVAEKMLEQMSSEEFDVDTIRLKIDDNMYGQVREYDVYEEVVYIIAQDVSEVKSYTVKGIDISKEYNALSWSYDLKSNVTIDGQTVALTNVYDPSGSVVIHGEKDGKYVPMSATEAKDLVGCTVKYEYVDLEKNVQTGMFGKITEVGEYDPDSTDLQEVKLTITHVGVQDYVLDLLGTVSEVVKRFFGCDFSQDTQTVTAYIKLEKEEESSFKLDTADKSQVYRISSSTQIPQFLKGNVQIKYRNGTIKQYDVVGQTDAVITTKGLFSTYYRVVNWGTVRVKFNVAGRTIEKYASIQKPNKFTFSASDYSVNIGDACYITSRVSLRAVYVDVVDGVEKETSTSITLSLDDFYINGTSLAQDSNDWGHHASYGIDTLVFYRSNDYVVQVVKNEFRSEPFILKVTDKAYVETEFALNVKNELPLSEMQDAAITVTGDVVNSLHGEGEDKDHTLKISIYDVAAGKSASEDCIKELSVGANALEPTTSANGSKVYSVFLPNLIKSGVAFKLSLSFANVGKYRVTVQIDSETVYKAEITVIAHA